MDCEILEKALVTFERHQGSPRIRLHERLDEGQRFDSRTVECEGADPLISYFAGFNEFTTPRFRFTTSSPLQEPTAFEVPLQSGPAKACALPNPATSKLDFPFGDYTARKIFINSSVDGTPVPVGLVHRKGLPLDHSAPMLVRAYGAYGAPFDADFCPLSLSLLQRGWVLAYLQVRGGGELGAAWHDQGRQLHKKNTFHDYLSCLEGLIDRGYSQPARIGAMGSSAGGLTLAAAINMRPELFRAAVLTYPFVEVLSVMLRPELPLTVPEYCEWGNPAADPAVRQYIASYDPYLNVPASPPPSFPSLFVTAAHNDIRVPFWIPCKYVAKLRHLLPAPFKNDLFLDFHFEGGHSGPGGRYSAAHTEATTAAFLLSRVSM